jgi:hypothetical protein
MPGDVQMASEEILLLVVHVVGEDCEPCAVRSEVSLVGQVAYHVGAECQADGRVEAVAVMARVLDVAEHPPSADGDAKLVLRDAFDSLDERLAEPHGPPG